MPLEDYTPEGVRNQELRRAPVPAALDALGETVEDLIRAVGVLTERLEPVLEPSIPNEAPLYPKRDVGSLLPNNILDRVDTLRSINHQINQLLGRLAL